jgi:hypothetical protein
MGIEGIIFWAPLISAVAAVSGAIIAFVKLRVSSIVRMHMFPRWVNEAKQSVILRIEVENKATIRIWKNLIQLQTFEYKLPVDASLSEWVSFTKKAYDDHYEKHPEAPRPIKGFKEPVEIFTSTNHIYPGEVISVERLCPFNTGNILQVGVQTSGRLGISGRIRGHAILPVQQWTTTIILSGDLPKSKY